MTKTTESTKLVPVDDEPLRVAILAGGLSHERDVSLRSGHRVSSVLKHLGHTVLILDVDARTIGSLRAFSRRRIASRASRRRQTESRRLRPRCVTGP